MQEFGSPDDLNLSEAQLKTLRRLEWELEYYRRQRARRQLLHALGILTGVAGVVLLLLLIAAVRSPSRMSNGDLLRLLSSNREGDRVAASIELARRKDPDALPPLLALLGSESWTTRRLAAEALGELGDRRACTALFALLDDSTSDVVEAAGRALAQIGGSDTVEGLLRELHDRQPSDRWKLAPAFGIIQDSRCIPDLMGAVGAAEDAHEQFHTTHERVTKALINQGTAAIQALVDSVLSGGPGAYDLARIEATTGTEIAPFHDALVRGDLEMLSRIYTFYFYLEQFDEELSRAEQEVLAASLLAYGDKEMAQTLANFQSQEWPFGSDILTRAAATWAEQHGYILTVIRR